jgi:uncharacterized ParB-like nuclease family protein
MNLNHIIKEELDSITKNKYFKDLQKELSKFNSDEELLRSGGLSIELLDRLAHGFSDDDIKNLKPDDLKIKWKGDLENVKYEIKKSGLTPQKWASKINLSEPIDVSYSKNKKGQKGFYIEDGHHRFMAAKILNKNLNVSLEININPITELTNMGYDEFHRYIFKLYKI